MAITIASVSGAACAEPDPTFGDPGGITTRQLPNEKTGGGADGPFAGTTATAPTTTLKAAHANSTGLPQPADYIDCMTCHKDGVNSQGAPTFTYGGRINENDNPVEGAEVIVLDGDTKLGPVKSDADGFFWFKGPAMKDDAKVYVRKGETVTPMSGSLKAATGGGCNGATCHAQGGTSGKINI